MILFTINQTAGLYQWPQHCSVFSVRLPSNQWKAYYCDFLVLAKSLGLSGFSIVHTSQSLSTQCSRVLSLTNNIIHNKINMFLNIIRQQLFPSDSSSSCLKVLVAPFQFCSKMHFLSVYVTYLAWDLRVPSCSAFLVLVVRKQNYSNQNGGHLWSWRELEHTSRGSTISWSEV